MKVVTSGDVALVYDDWHGSSVDQAGKAVAMNGKAIEIVRRQADGTWLLVVGDDTVTPEAHHPNRQHAIGDQRRSPAYTRAA